MKLLNLRIRAVQGCKEIDFRTIDDHLILVGGKNGQGKTSLLNGVRMALMGKREFPWPERVIHEDANRAEVEITLSGDPSMAEDRELKVVLEVDRKRGGEVDTINIFDSAGDKAPSPRTLLKELYSTIAFDPLQFEKMPPKRQRELIAELVGVDLQTPREEYQELYDDRAFINKEHASLKVKESELVWHEDAPVKPVDTSKLLEELSANQQARTQYAEAESDCVKAAAKEKSLAEKHETAKSEVKRLSDLLKEAKATVKSCKEGVDFAKQKTAVAKEDLAKLPSVPDDAELMQKIADAGSLNEKFQHHERNKELQAACVAKKAESDALTEKMKRVTEKVEESLWKATFPVEGMTLDRDGVLLHGRPLASCSRSERIKASALVGMAMNPKLRLLICEDGSDLDEDALDALDEILTKHDFQALIELVCRSTEDEQRCKVVMQNGVPK